VDVLLQLCMGKAEARWVAASWQRPTCRHGITCLEAFLQAKVTRDESTDSVLLFSSCLDCSYCCVTILTNQTQKAACCNSAVFPPGTCGWITQLWFESVECGL